MLTRILSSLSFQISAAFLLLVLLFAGASLYFLGSFQRQLAYDSVVDIAGRLELTAQQLHGQAMNYEQNAPRDYATYYRDVRLYYQDLMSHIETFDRVVDTFMRGDFRGEMDGPMPWLLHPNIGGGVTEAIHALEQTWSDYRVGLFEALGQEAEEPRLEYAAKHNIANHATLEQASNALTDSLRRWTGAEHHRILRVSLLVVVTAAGLALLILLALYFKALAPFERTIAGFQRVADGDFGHRLEVTGASEVRQLTESFNQLSGRLNVLFQLLERLHQGNDVDEVIGFLSREFSDLLRIDWIGVVLVSSDGASVRLEVSYLDGAPERLSKQLFLLKGTLLEQSLEQGAPMHIAEMDEKAARNPRYQFLRSLVRRGLHDAIFLPLTPQTQTPVPAVIVFATRKQNRYDSAHLRFLDNIAKLITQSFGRTVRLAEHGRLAAIGEFASGIAHELRTPLATISLAVDYFDRLELPENARKRIRLAKQESARMRQLLEEILLYAKPLNLDLRPLNATETLRRFIEEHRTPTAKPEQKILLENQRAQAEIMADKDRLTQIFANLTQNACEAAPEGAEIVWSVRDDPSSGAVTLELRNPGPPIPPELLPRVTEPFFSTKQSGTGLGLAIVRRLTQVHGGEMKIASDEAEGTRVKLTLPRLELPTEPVDNPADRAGGSEKPRIDAESG
ncbi:MAG: ATP-binding protein [Pseudomonadota bacterium]|nr:ATP-binding protein [Pseudomonadota bacterium]